MTWAVQISLSRDLKRGFGRFRQALPSTWPLDPAAKSAQSRIIVDADHSWRHACPMSERNTPLGGGGGGGGGRVLFFFV